MIHWGRDYGKLMKLAFSRNSWILFYTVGRDEDGYIVEDDSAVYMDAEYNIRVRVKLASKRVPDTSFLYIVYDEVYKSAYWGTKEYAPLYSYDSGGGDIHLFPVLKERPGQGYLTVSDFVLVMKKDGTTETLPSGSNLLIPLSSKPYD